MADALMRILAKELVRAGSERDCEEEEMEAEDRQIHRDGDATLSKGQAMQHSMITDRALPLPGGISLVASAWEEMCRIGRQA
jgi:hypothetical protein